MCGAVQLSDLQLKANTHLEEREFYFSKLREIEILCQMDEIKDNPVSNELYQMQEASSSVFCAWAMHAQQFQFSKHRFWLCYSSQYLLLRLLLFICAPLWSRGVQFIVEGTLSVVSDAGIMRVDISMLCAAGTIH